MLRNWLERSGDDSVSSFIKLPSVLHLIFHPLMITAWSFTLLAVIKLSFSMFISIFWQLIIEFLVKVTCCHQTGAIWLTWNSLYMKKQKILSSFFLIANCQNKVLVLLQIVPTILWDWGRGIFLYSPLSVFFMNSGFFSIFNVFQSITCSYYYFSVLYELWRLSHWSDCFLAHRLNNKTQSHLIYFLSQLRN